MFGHWYVVASQTKVKIYTEHKETKKLSLVKTLENPLGRERNRTMIKKDAGRGVKSMGRMGSVHYSEKDRHDPHEEAAQQFAKSVGVFLKKAKQKKDFSTLTVAAEPRFMGKIRAELADDVSETVSQWLRKDFEKTPEATLNKLLLKKK